MGAVAAELDSQFTVALGDNFYGFGVTNVSDPRFQETFEVSRGQRMALRHCYILNLIWGVYY